MKAKISAVLMATFLLFNFAYGQNKVEKKPNKSLYGKKSYDYKSIGKSKVEKLLRKESTENRQKQNGSSNNARRSKGNNGKWSNGQNNFYHNQHFGFDCHDFGFNQAFNPVLDRAAFITENMDNILRLKRHQEFDIFRLNVLFVSDMQQLQHQINNYAYGASYGNPVGSHHLEKLIKRNYFAGLNSILNSKQSNRLNYYFQQFDLLGNRAFASFGNYSFGNYGNNNYSGNNCSSNGNCVGNGQCNNNHNQNYNNHNYGNNFGNGGYNQYGYLRKSKTN